ncbi:sigma-70 family RNA polymerase sigma factor [Donghicola tyrosinivorans]|jgi:RNA polymerase sigma factor for flagellar operon FliA|uniref:RNA polymerase sigma factor for flagellar operon FliA n=1 Tax=Donghicola tyrosinivorans TaxID=1652492 RepID=A0A2T0WIA5_9RHOB|nr:FliA/WhiG family RNA polymerase sigma factor [Donghicola tyrosinivorans]PRY86439.1 RNA polymerase sigma factor for flagellar operon FliA [Donghicola tyrosinivorans]
MIAPKAYSEQAPRPDKLVEDHMHLVKRLAWHFLGRVGRFVELEDLMQAGYLGLVDASQRYTPREGVTFSAYAAIRVRGSIVDLLRRNSNLCRKTIAMQQQVKAAINALEGELGRTPEPKEVAAKMEIPIEEYEDWQARFQVNRVQSLDEVYSDQSMLFEDRQQNSEDLTHQSQLKVLLRKALEKLPEREALLLHLYYVEELNVYEVAAILGVTTGRVSQIKKAAIMRLRGLIGDVG